MEYSVIYDIDPIDFINFRKVLSWKEINLTQVEKALNNTMCKVSVRVQGKTVALGRLVGDYSCKGVLSDILVHPDYQRKGFGKIVVTKLLQMVQDNLNEGDLFQIEATPTHGNREFYVKYGFKYKPENQDGVYVWLKK